MATDQSTRIVSTYDRVADTWDVGAGARSPQFESRLRNVVIDLLRPAAGAPLALELGVGTGWLVPVTSRLFGTVRAIDTSERMLAVCRSRVEDARLHNVIVEHGDAMTLSNVDDSSVDVIYAIGLLAAVPAPDRVITTCARVLKPGGVMIISIANGSCPWHSIKDRWFGGRNLRASRSLRALELTQLAAKAGLSTDTLMTWGLAPRQLAFAPAVAALGCVERLVTTMGMSGSLAVLSGRFTKIARGPRMSARPARC